MSGRVIRSLLNTGSEVGLQAAAWLVGRSFSEALAGMRMAQWMPAEQLAQRQNARIAAILRYAASGVPFYKRLGFPAGELSADALPSFPVLNKLEIRSRLEEFVAEGVPEHRKIARLTSGSTGEPFLYYIDREAIPVVYASHLFYDSWFGLRPFDKYLRFVRQHPVDRLGPSASWCVRARQRSTDVLKNTYERLTQEFVPVWEVDRDQIDLVYRRIAAFRPDFVLGYTSTLATAAEYLLEHGRPMPRPLRGVITIGETLTPLRSRLIRQYFQAPIINRYGLREFGAWSAQNCLSSPEDFHINTEMVALEILRKDGTPADPGEPGRVVITDLSNRVMPFIRYDTGDFAAQGDGTACACGRGFQRVGQIEGRAVESLVTPSGKVVSSIVLGRYLREGGAAFQHTDHLRFINHYQAIQEESFDVRLLVVPAPGFDSGRKARLSEDLARLLGNEVHVAVEEVAEIPLERSGKRPLIKKAATAVGHVG